MADIKINKHQYIFSHFENRDNRLFLDNVDLPELAIKEGTPLLVTSEQRLINNYRTMANAFSRRYNKFQINYAIKSNSNPAILSVFRKEGAGADAASLGELYIAKIAGINKDKIIFTPNYASMTALESALDSGIIINFDDITQLELVKQRKVETVSFRINPGIGAGEFSGIVTGGHGSKFGIPESYSIQSYRKAIKYGAKRFGIHMMAGSNNLDPEYFGTITAKFFDIISKIQDSLKIDFEFIDIGGGFGVPYRPNENPLDMEIVAERIIEQLKDKILNKRSVEPKLIVEPGRYLVADSTVLLGSVTSIKNYDKLIIGTDVGMNILIRPALYGAYHHIVVANNLNEPLKNKATIVGQVCENTDKIAEDREFPDTIVNDILAIFNAGAYVFSMGSDYNAFLRPKEILIDRASEIHIIRERGLYNDLIRNVKIPEYLMF
ncbi:MAG: diaminopimelate decarboxylase [Thermoplasmata archaeon]